jgi:hypothetical protein
MKLRLICVLFSDPPEIVFRRTSIWAIDNYPTISIRGEVIIIGSLPR